MNLPQNNSWIFKSDIAVYVYKYTSRLSLAELVDKQTEKDARQMFFLVSDMFLRTFATPVLALPTQINMLSCI